MRRLAGVYANKTPSGPPLGTDLSPDCPACYGKGVTTTREKSRDAREALAFALKNRSNAFAIHYACELFDLPSPRIISIAARNFGTNATSSFSMDLAAAKHGLPLAGASADDLDRAERKMLDEFNAFLAKHQGHHWIHWNMRDAKFGFDALENRHRGLRGKPINISPANRFDLSSRLFDLYGDRHTPKANRLQFLATKNGITLSDFAEGDALAQMVAKGDYGAVHRSTLRKVDVIYEIADKAVRNRLKTDARVLDPYGGWTGALHYLRDHPLYLILVVVLIPVLGLILRGKDVVAWIGGLF